MQTWLNYHHLLYFKIIAETGSLAKASVVLRVGQSALSMQLKVLEDRLQQQLFERKQKKLILTEAGKLVLEYAQEIFDLGTEMLDTLSDKKDRSRIQVQIGVEEGVPHFAATKLLTQCLDNPIAAPAVTHGAADALVQDLVEHRLDLLLLLGPAHTKDKNILFQKRVMREPLYAVASKEFVGLKKNFPKSLSDQPVLLPSHLSIHRHEIERFFHEGEIHVNLALETDEPVLLLNLAIEGRGISFIPEDSLRSALKDKKLILLGELPVHMELWLIGLKRKMNNSIAEKLMKSFSL